MYDESIYLYQALAPVGLSPIDVDEMELWQIGGLLAAGQEDKPVDFNEIRMRRARGEDIEMPEAQATPDSMLNMFSSKH